MWEGDGNNLLSLHLAVCFKISFRAPEEPPRGPRVGIIPTVYGKRFGTVFRARGAVVPCVGVEGGCTRVQPHSHQSHGVSVRMQKHQPSVRYFRENYTGAWCRDKITAAPSLTPGEAVSMRQPEAVSLSSQHEAA